MVAIPEPRQTTAKAIYDDYVARNAAEPPREHLGASLIGHHCERYLWLTFRWAVTPSFSGQLLRLFETGRREEPRVHAELRRIGVELHIDDNGKQIACRDAGGHFGGSVDGIGKGFPEAPKAWAVLECKTMNTKSFADTKAKGVKASKPQHYAQMQTYMHLLKIDRAMYIAVCKDTDELWCEWVHEDKQVGLDMLTKARRVLGARTPAPKISEDPANWQCKMCDAWKFCHQEERANKNCRTCCHSTPVADGRWHCSLHDKGLTTREQQLGCEAHLYIPDMLPGLTPVDGDTGHIDYIAKDGSTFRDGPPAKATGGRKRRSNGLPSGPVKEPYLEPDLNDDIPF